MRDKCNDIHIKQSKHLSKIFTPLCLKSHDGYYFNILRMITICYHLYVENSIYSMAYNKKKDHLYEHLLLKNKMSKWCDNILWKDIVR